MRILGALLFIVIGFFIGVWYSYASTEVRYLALNMYHAEPWSGPLGREALSAVVFNRATDASHRWPRTVRGVITQGCNFSWYCDGKPDTPTAPALWREIKRQAWWMFLKHSLNVFHDPTDGATWYHHKNISRPSSFPHELDCVGGYGGFVFYR